MATPQTDLVGGKPCVVVIGSGMAGAGAADYLRHKAEVIVVEAKDRIGGRTWTHKFSDGSWIDLGAAWVHGTGPSFPMHDVFKRLGVEIDHRFYAGDEVCKSLGTMTMFEARGKKGAPPEPAVPISTCKLMCRGLALKRMADRLGVEIENAGKLKDQDISIEQLLDNMKSGGGCCSFRGFDAYGEEGGNFFRNLPEFILNAGTGMATRDLSARSIGQAGTGDASGNMMGVPVGGWQTVADGLLKGIDVRLNSPVKAIRQIGDTGIEVELRSGEKLNCSACICTVPLGVLKAGDIAFEPPLPAAKLTSIKKIGFGNVVRIAVKFDKNFWTGRVGKLWQRIPVSDGRREVDALEFTTWADWSLMVGTPIIQCFFYADTALKAESMADKDLLENFKLILSTHVPKEEVMAAKIVEYQITRWTTDEFSRGAYSGPGLGCTEKDRVEVQKAFGRIHFAGEHVSTDNAASVHGAYLTGLDAAKEAMAHKT